jgi:hypothetical protein
VRRYCHDFDVMFKLNTVVNKFNVHENMADNVNEINPVRLVVEKKRQTDRQRKKEKKKKKSG